MIHAHVLGRGHLSLPEWHVILGAVSAVRVYTTSYSLCDEDAEATSSDAYIAERATKARRSFLLTTLH